MKTAMLITTMFYSCILQAQVSRLEEIVTLHADDIALEQIITMIHQDYDIRFSHGHFPALKMHVSVSVTESPLKEFLRLALDQAGLYYKTINGAVVLSEKHGRVKRTVPDREPAGTTKTLATKKSLEKNNREHYTMESTPKPVVTSGNNELIPHDLGQDSTYSIRDSTVNTTMNAPEYAYKEAVTKSTKRLPLYAWAGYSFEFARHTFSTPAVPFYRFYSERDIGLHAGMLFCPQSRISAYTGVSYITRNFALEYNYKMIDKDPMPVPDKTKVNITYLEIPLQVAFRFFRYRTFSVHTTGGIHAKFRIDQQEHTMYQNAHPEETEVFLKSNVRFAWAGSLGILLHQPIGERWAMMIQPAYSWYNNPVNEETMNSGTKLLRIQTTLALRLTR